MARIFELAHQPGPLKDPALAGFQMSDYLRINGGSPLVRPLGLGNICENSIEIHE